MCAHDEDNIVQQGDAILQGLKFREVDRWSSAGFWLDPRRKPGELVLIRAGMDYEHVHIIFIHTADFY